MPTKPKSPFPNPAAPLPGEADVLANVLANLADHDAKLVYADWLEDRDDPRGPLLREFVTAFRAGKKLPALKAVPRAWGDLVGLTLTAELQRTPLAGRIDTILAVARPAIDFVSARAPENALAVGASKIGGRPDLAARTKWPKFRGRPLSFLGQFNLADLAPSPAARDLPARGLFSLFALYDADEGNDDFSKGSWCFLHFPDAAKLARHEFDDELPDGSRFPSCRVSYYEVLTLPDDRSPFAPDLDAEPDDDVSDAYFEFHMDSALGDHFLGYPFAIQDDVLHKKSVRHLLTLGGSDAAGWEWGDGGALYFTIDGADLKKRRFDRVRMEMQCD